MKLPTALYCFYRVLYCLTKTGITQLCVQLTSSFFWRREISEKYCYHAETRVIYVQVVENVWL